VKERETVILVPVPEAEALLAKVREKHDPSFLRGVPAHITLLYPFYPLGLVTQELIVRLENVFAGFAPFSFELATVETFPNAVYLDPAPHEPFLLLTDAIFAEFPERPPYGGIHSVITPHLTIVPVGEDQDLAEIRADIEASISDQLPMRVWTDRALLAIQDERGDWSSEETFYLGRKQG
jgi:2'-5' RNA ligase